MDKQHFPQFYRAHIKQVYKFLLFRLGGRKAMAEDLTQDVFIKALNAFESYDPEKGESAWILTIARNHLINTLQKEREQISLEEIEQTMAETTGLAEKMAISYDEQRVLAAIAQLPEEDANIVRLKHLEGWSYEEIAKLSKKTAGALRIQSHRALKALQAILKRK